MSSDEEYEQERKFHQAISEGLVPKLDASAVAMVVAPYTDEDHPHDVNFAVQLGLMILMDKPIIVVVGPGMTISKKLELVADKIVHVDITSDDGAKLIAEAAADLTRELGL
jgi:hypothetical protein